MTKAISYGGGVQSTAMIVLATQGKIRADVALFANTGDDSENPDTLKYVREIMIPWSAERGLEIVELQRNTKQFGVHTLYEHLTDDKFSSISIPVFMSGNGAPGNRNCTSKFKIDVIHKYLKQHGASKKNPATTYIGISIDEIERLHNRNHEEFCIVSYPLIDLRLTRNNCENIIRDAGLPVPPKSSCYFCPFKRTAQWREMKRDQPELFAKAVELEKILNQKRKNFGKDEVFLSQTLRPLSELDEAQQMLFSEELFCDTGHCMT